MVQIWAIRPPVVGVAVTMTSREIAALVEKRHDNVKRTIETLAERRVIGHPQIEEYPDSLGRPAAQYLVSKRDSYVIVAELEKDVLSFEAMSPNAYGRLRAARSVFHTVWDTSTALAAPCGWRASG